MNSSSDPRHPTAPRTRLITGTAVDVGFGDSSGWRPPSDDDLSRFSAGGHLGLHQFMGAHRTAIDGVDGVAFAVWAPAALSVAVAGDFNDWYGDTLHRWTGSGVWSGFIPGAEVGQSYHYLIETADGVLEKGDPFAAWWQVPPGTASRIWADEYQWGDEAWLKTRGDRIAHDAPVAIYEMHLGSWMTHDGHPLGYRALAGRLVEHLGRLEFTHVEFLPVTEHPFGGSWGYQALGFFAPTSRWGTPEDFKYLVDTLHQAGYGVILDWVPSHFAVDSHGLARFDGTPLYEPDDPMLAAHPDWGTFVFDLARSEIRSFLMSSAACWLEKFHIDGIRVDAVASMLYLDYSRDPGEWVPNQYGGNENLAAIGFLRSFNDAVHQHFPGVATFAEESTAWPMVSGPTYVGGLGFDYKWDMGWMHDTLSYLDRDPIHRAHHHGEITFRAIYAFSENYTLPLSHDEVVHGKGSLLTKMPGDRWQQFANLRLLLADQFFQPGKKLLFMGGEFGQAGEWADVGHLEWNSLTDEAHSGIMRLVRDLARHYRDLPALHVRDHDPSGFEWLIADDADRSVLAWQRTDGAGNHVVAVFNFTPVVLEGYELPVPHDGPWHESVTTDHGDYGGSGVMQSGPLEATDGVLKLTLPPLAALLLTPRP
ncbi:MAG: 1,4-alpha-glucan branching protein GlgB [Acidimicrobiia bacterium]|nr:1,4-alpha-glucan branching protein GlgB [Acidimicrobiia bacterium]